MATQEELEKIKKQAEQIKGQVDTLASAEKMGMNITPQTTIAEAEQFLKNRQTSSSFDFLGKDLDSVLGNISGGITEDLLRKLSQPLTTQQLPPIQEMTQQAKQTLLTQKSEAIELAKSFMETEQQKVLSTLGLRAGVGSLLVESIMDIQRKNALSLANLASQYDQAIANLDLQSAQSIRQEMMDLINANVQLENLRLNQAITTASASLQIGQEQTKNLFETIQTLISGEKAKTIDELPEKTRQMIEPLFNKIDKLSNLPLGTTRMKIEKIMSSGSPLENAKIITTSDGGIYLFGTRDGNVVFEQLKSENFKEKTSIPSFDLDYLLWSDFDNF